MLTWFEAIDKFRAHQVEQEKSAHTINNYAEDLLAFQSWSVSHYMADPDPTALTSAELREWKQYLVEAKKLAPSTVNRKLAALRSFNAYLATIGAAELVQAPKSMRQETPPPRWLSRREQLALVRAVEKQRRPRDIALVKLMLHAGLRVAEAQSLRWTALDLGERKGSVKIVGKGRKQRTVPLNVEARNALLELCAGWQKQSNRAVFNGPHGGLTIWSLQNIVTSYGPAAKIEHLTCHVLRHTFCRRLAEAGVRLEEIAALAGHESIETTRRYVEPGQDDLRQAVERLAGAED
jgi:site-specific recombinase XerD